MPEAGSIIGHAVAVAADVGDLVIIAVVAPMEAGGSAHICWGAFHRDGALAIPAHSCGIVAQSGQREFS